MGSRQVPGTGEGAQPRVASDSDNELPMFHRFDESDGVSSNLAGLVWAGNGGMDGRTLEGYQITANGFAALRRIDELCARLPAEDRTNEPGPTTIAKGIEAAVQLHQDLGAALLRMGAIDG